MKKILYSFLFVLSVFKIEAQQDEQVSLYMMNPLAVNPAYAGSRDAISITALGRFQWINYKGAPVTQWLSIHAPILGKRLGVGMHAVNDKIGSRSRTGFYGDVSANIQLNKKTSRLSVGLTGGADILSYDFAGLTASDPNDPFYGQAFTATKPNVGAGIYYYSDKHYIGISSPRLIESKVKDANAVLKNLNTRHFFLTAGYIFKVNSVVKIKPSILAKYTPLAPMGVDLNASVLLHEKLWLGALFRLNESVGINAMFVIKENFRIGYAYDFPVNGLRTYQSGSHDFMLQFDLKHKNAAFVSPRYF